MAEPNRHCWVGTDRIAAGFSSRGKRNGVGVYWVEVTKHESNHRGANKQPYHRPRSVEELTRRNVETIIRLEEATRAKRSRFDQIADAVTRVCGSMRFVVIHVVWYAGWIGANVALAPQQRWDPFPFPFLTLTVSLEAIFLSVFILISQNRQSALSERRAQLDLQVNLLSEQENTKMLELLAKIGKKLGVDVSDDPEVQVLEEATRPKKLLQQIDQTMARNEKS
jgi:uncharacterized membrane protein